MSPLLLYAKKLFQRPKKLNMIFKKGCIFQQFIINQYIKIESDLPSNLRQNLFLNKLLITHFFVGSLEIQPSFIMNQEQYAPEEWCSTFRILWWRSLHPSKYA